MPEQDDQPVGPLIDPDASRFMDELTRAITSCTNDRTRTNAAALTYRGIDLRPLIERHLYFSIVNDEALFQAFKAGATDAALPPTSEVIRPYLLKGRTSAPPGLSATVRGVSARLRDRSADPETTADVTFWNGAEGHDVLFHVGAEKFLRYLKPVADRFAGRAAFLIYDAPALLPFLTAAGVPVVSITSVPGRQPAGRVTPELGPWSAYCTDHDALCAGLRQAGCSRVIVAEGNSPPNALIAGAARALGIRSVCIQQGWSPFIHPGFRNLHFDAMCMWGELFAELLQPHNPRQRFRVTGHHLLRIADDPPTAARRAVGFFLQKNSRLITPGAWAAMLDLVAWTADSFPDHAVLVREHPGAPLTPDETAVFAGRRNIEVVPAAVVPLADVLARCKVAVSIFSTTLIEAVGAGAVPLIINLTGSDRFCPDLEAAGAGIEVKDMAAARAALGRVLGGEEPGMVAAMRGLRRRLFAATGAEALRHIEHAIDPPGPAPGIAMASIDRLRSLVRAARTPRVGHRPRANGSVEAE